MFIGLLLDDKHVLSSLVIRETVGAGELLVEAKATVDDVAHVSAQNDV